MVPKSTKRILLALAALAVGASLAYLLLPRVSAHPFGREQAQARESGAPVKTLVETWRPGEPAKADKLALHTPGWRGQAMAAEVPAEEMPRLALAAGGRAPKALVKTPAQAQHKV